MGLIEFIAVSVSLRWVIFDYKNTYRFRLFLATFGASAEAIKEASDFQKARDGIEQMFGVTQTNTPAELAKTLGHNIRAELLQCVYCQTVETASIILLCATIISQPVSPSLSGVFSWSLRILLAGFVGMILQPIFDALIEVLEEGSGFSLIRFEVEEDEADEQHQN